ncbi:MULTISPECIES: hypothetical protein [Haloferax]|uniref:Uncharacterized protein n=1 Tax=Haloferax sp. Atlit-48N TaxID=2077198 RepID=A0ACD5HUZ7_9EURY|nr:MULTISPECIES: hypothetical protein [Haloferax]
MSNEKDSPTNTVVNPVHDSIRVVSPGRILAITALIGLAVLTQPVAAQDGVICSTSKLPQMLEGFFQLTTALGLIGLIVVWQGDSLFQMFTTNHEQKAKLKEHMRVALKSAVTLLVLGPLYTVAGSLMGLPLAQCVDLSPW